MFERLQKLNITVSYQTVIDLVTKMGVGHDLEVLDWRNNLKKLISVSSCVL